ncbi:MULTISPECIES: sugar ABC transporter ATP-binding protein [Bosea]|uniref:sugar ABC transporter ATP-binding protein n=1 Tax=Bosea TaxID=85413 RepID=UPI00214F668D|nr:MULTISPECIES: sugar ABC transporter ATP-binding protein [Bosea]MCR4523701.1 sugar ABC transporter ATP-binding protein [Bosea sp. 47.2.35]MDR6830090.1 ribose transport system ATP-binding protein [Bosea robiniae]MDR6896949.1 ribose transport system ATP-binding protein [Bosea sp. BE109]MDR7140370.1 ribose transport system ATP-binding protein [Bosea sp. BE168]MDR7177043.1 ribose transport system ATP-binding protein [Bosea sp. BE271]
MSTTAGLAVAFDGIVKRFGPVEVLHGVSFSLEPGKVYGLLGENGAGKSTLMKILSGYEQPSEGRVLIDGEPVAFSGSREAEAKGIVLIHQEFNLAEDLTIAGNIFLGHERRKGWLLDEEAMRREAEAALAQVGLARAPDTPVRRLIVAEKQLVEIAKALSRKARLLIMDEPTATLTPSEAGRLFALIERMRAEGITVVYISHKLDEVERITDEVIVMRDGRFVGRAPTASLTRQAMATMMVGREIADLFPEKIFADPALPPALSVEEFSVPGWASDISFAVRPGEILGFAGLVGAGRTELFEGILGLRPGTGTIKRDGRPIQLGSPRDATRHGLAYLSEDRKGKGLHVDFPLRPNLTLMALERYAKPLLDHEAEQKALVAAVGEFGIRAGSLGMKAASLSGGNQQKLALARVLHPAPRVLVLDEPTRGVDVGAKREIYFLIQKLAAQGLALIVISSELIELIGLAHRVAVMRGGRIVATVEGDEMTEATMIAHATGTRHVAA